MSVLYRAIWSGQAGTDVGELIETLTRCAAQWARDGREGTLPEGHSELWLSSGTFRTIEYRSFNPSAFEIITRDQKGGTATEWTTTIRAVCDTSGVHVLVENSMESDNLIQRISIGRPRVVRDLIRATQKPALGGSGLLTEPMPIPAKGIAILTDILAAPDRTLPVIVCSESWNQHRESWTSTARGIATRSEGVAIVVTLDNDAVTAFRTALGDLAVWGGGVRIYAPIPVDQDSDGWQHRYYSGARLENSHVPTINRIVYSVAQLSARRRVPDAFDVFEGHDDHAPSLAHEVIAQTTLKDDYEQLNQRLDLEIDDHNEVSKELSRAKGHLSRIRECLETEGRLDLFWGTQYEPGNDIPDEVQDVSGAVLAAQSYLSDQLELPPSAEKELEDVDTAPNAFAWGNTAWNGLRALAEYSKDRSRGWDKGGFWEWCKDGPALGWPATKKKLAMKESESVHNNDKFRTARIFDIDEAVRPDGRIFMEAHLKIAEGGGRLAPRIYFYDDTNGATGKVHIGFVGPHYLVPNKSTN